MKKDVLTLIRKIKWFLKMEDVSWIEEFVLYDKLELIVEFICDKALEYSVVLDEKIGKKIQKIVRKYHLNPKRSWDALMVKENETDRKYFLFYRKVPYEKVYKECKRILEIVKKMFDPGEFSFEEDFVEHNEFALAMEGVCLSLSKSKARISRKLFDKIKSLVADMSIDRKYLKGIVVRRKRHAKV